MAAKKNQKPFAKKAKIQDTAGGNFGNYSEDTGGGTPFAKGNSNTRTTKANGKLRQEKNDTMQPRTSDGKFTYNSVNGKETKYGGRGETVNPLLTGGENGIKISDVEEQFEGKSGAYWDKYKDEWYREGDEQIVGLGKGVMKTKVAKRSIWEIGKSGYSEKLGGFNFEDENWDKSKSGRVGKEEKAAMAEAKKSKANTYVHSQEGGIKQHPKAAALAKALAGMAKKPQPAPAPSPIAPAQPAPGAQTPASSGIQAASGQQLSHTKQEIDDMREALSDEDVKAAVGGGIDVDSITDEQLDSVYDEFIDLINNLKASGGSDAGEQEPEESEGEGDEAEGDSDAIRKIKGMGFSE